MADLIQFPKENPTYIIKTFIEGFGLEYPKDFEKFLEVMSRFDEGGTVEEFYDALVEAFPDKKESIMNFPMYTEVDGELVRIRFPDKEKSKSRKLEIPPEVFRIIGPEYLVSLSPLAYNSALETLEEMYQNRGLEWIKKNVGMLRDQLGYLKTLS
jgi:hypothetical protein